MKLLIPLLLALFFTTGCELSLTDRRHFDPEMERRERNLMIRKDFYTGEERRIIDKDLDRIQNNYTISASGDLFEMFPAEKKITESNKAVDDKIMNELERSSKEFRKK